MTRCVRAFALSLLAVAWSVGCSQTGETPDDGEVRTGTGASGGSVVMTGNGGQGGGTTTPPYCGDGSVDFGETCDDGNNMSGDGCDAFCMTECTSACGSCDDQGRCIPAVCGDGRADTNEECDDGNIKDKDGCAHDCRLEFGYHCPRVGRPCVPRCGDRLVAGPETCDDGNVGDGDGCSSACLVEPTTAICGDGVIQGAEACDPPTGIAFTAFPCAQDCRYQSYCGDEKVDADVGEECDLGIGKNLSGYGEMGCTPTCKRSHYCGDRIVDPGEQCDDGIDNGTVASVTGCTRDCHILLL